MSDCLVLMVTWCFSFEAHRRSRALHLSTSASITTVFLRDGTVFFLAFIVLYAMEIVGWCTESMNVVSEFILPFCPFFLTMHAQVLTAFP
ncbi:hypothetical protein DAEQUDRAFT_394051 [Daedalea quercina L-15889]|uniref:Uncharacterized protein n=1 Tax=Daedalea quercina L-15889 TaxID=1314783 RepID=A0A165NWU9_9APHY|nr:hypothetical protein DAEQUDRAFT_394051 [Daedalea quercina L-15889]